MPTQFQSDTNLSPPLTNPKPGYKTTEFYLTLAAQVIAALVLFGVIGQDEADLLTGGINDLVTKVSASVVSVVALWKYVASRAAVKSGNT